MRALYISYDGMTDPLGRSQVLPYLQGLAARGHEITLLSCEKPARMADEAAVRSICKQAGIEWQPVAYHKWPPILSGMLDVAVLKRRAAQLHRLRRFELVHSRSYMAAIAGDWLKRRHRVPFLFDMRGFWADERLERGIWPANNPLFRAAYTYFKRLERRFFRDADAIVSLTASARREIESWPADRRPGASITVIPCCVDLNLFQGTAENHEATRERLGIDPHSPVLLYVGSIGGAYLMTEMLGLFRVYRKMRPGSRFLFVSGHPREEIERLAKEHGIEPTELVVVSAARDEVPALIAAADIGVSFILASYSAKASCPTKFGEMLAMEVPVIANAGVGDIAEIIRETGAGAVVKHYDDASLSTAITQAEAAECDPGSIRAAAVGYFALETGVDRYDAIYRAIGASQKLS